MKIRLCEYLTFLLFFFIKTALAVNADMPDTVVLETIGEKRASFPFQTLDIIESIDGSIWVSSEMGVYCYNRQYLKRIAWFDDKVEVLKILKNQENLYFIHRNLDISIFNGYSFRFKQFNKDKSLKNIQSIKFYDAEIDCFSGNIVLVADLQQKISDSIRVLSVKISSLEIVDIIKTSFKTGDNVEVVNLDNSIIELHSQHMIEKYHLQNNYREYKRNKGSLIKYKYKLKNFSINYIDNQSVIVARKNSNSKFNLIFKGVVVNVIEDFEGNIWISTQTDGVYFFDFYYRNEIIYDISNFDYGHHVRFLKNDSLVDSIFYSKKYGFFRKNKSNKHPIYSTDKIEYFFNNEYFKVGYDAFWYNKSKYFLNSKIISHVKYHNDFFLATTNGIFQFNLNDKVLVNRFNGKLSSMFLNNDTIYFSCKGSIYGLDLKANKIRKIYNSQDFIYSFIKEEASFIYTTDNGVFKISNKKLAKKISNHPALKHIIKIGEEYYCSNGLALIRFIDPKISIQSEIRLIVTNFNKYLNQFNQSRSINFFTFIKSNYNINAKVKYTLIGTHDTIISQIGNSGWINVNNLNSGNYKLCLIGISDIGLLTHSVILKFNVLPQFYETNSFKLLVVILIFLFVLSVIYSYKRKIENNNLIIENENVRLHLLKSQLNPHFLFNAINSLKSLMYKDRFEKAISYSDNISHFLRSVLSVHQAMEVSLEKELELVSNYIAIENVRLGNKVQLQIQLDKGVSELLIPSNILQPILENSIKYGVTAAETELSILLKVKLDEGFIYISIQDDGKVEIGDSVKQGNSFSLESLRKRISSFNAGKPSQSVELVPIYTNGQKTGTLTTITLRVKTPKPAINT